MAQTRRLLCSALVIVFCLAQSTLVISGDIDGLSSKIDADLFLEDEGSGDPSDEVSGYGSGYSPVPDDDEDRPTAKPHPPKTTPKSSVGPPDDIINGPGGGDVRRKPEPGEDINFPPGEETNIFGVKEDPQASFFSQPGILAAIICGAIVGLLCAILLVMFIVYRMRKKDEGSYVLDDSKRTTPSYGKSKEFFA